MIAKVLANTGQIRDHVDAKTGQQPRRTDARKLQQLGRIRGTGAKQHFASGDDAAGLAVRRLGIANGAGPALPSLDCKRRRAGLDLDVGAAHGRTQVCGGSTNAPAPFDDPLEIAGSGLSLAVVVGIARNADLPCRINEGVTERVEPVAVAHVHGSALAAVAIVVIADAVLAALEIGQQFGVRPASVAKRRPAVEVEAIAAVEDQAVE